MLQSCGGAQGCNNCLSGPCSLRLSPAAECRGLGAVCDGDVEVRKAARDELRKGAHCIKIMASGGVSSPTDK